MLRRVAAFCRLLWLVLLLQREGSAVPPPGFQQKNLQGNTQVVSQKKPWTILVTKPLGSRPPLPHAPNHRLQNTVTLSLTSRPLLPRTPLSELHCSQNRLSTPPTHPPSSVTVAHTTRSQQLTCLANRGTIRFNASAASILWLLAVAFPIPHIFCQTSGYRTQTRRYHVSRKEIFKIVLPTSLMPDAVYTCIPLHSTV